MPFRSSRPDSIRVKLFEGTPSDGWFTFAVVMCLVVIGPCVGVIGALLRHSLLLTGLISVMAISLLLLQLVRLIRRGLRRDYEKVWAMIAVVAIVTIAVVGLLNVLKASI